MKSFPFVARPFCPPRSANKRYTQRDLAGRSQLHGDLGQITLVQLCFQFKTKKERWKSPQQRVPVLIGQRCCSSNKMGPRQCYQYIRESPRRKPGRPCGCEWPVSKWTSCLAQRAYKEKSISLLTVYCSEWEAARGPKSMHCHCHRL